MSNVFISYRRDDSAPYAGRISDRLSSAVGSDHVFMDVQDIAPGADFTEAIDKTVGRCDALVAVIGPRWLELLRARSSELDFVEREIAVALRRGIAVIPVLVGGANMPSEHELPPELAPLARRQAVAVRDESFDADMHRVIQGFDRRPNSAKKIVWGVIAAGILIAVTGAAILLLNSRREASIEGQWTARMQREGQRPYTIRLRFATSGRDLTGSVEYPTGSGAIQGGTFEDGRLAFFTKHVPQFESDQATITFSGEVQGREIELTATTPDGAVATGTARKAQ